MIFLTDETGARSSAFPLSFRVYAVLPVEKPSSCSHFLEVMDAAVAQWQHAGLRGSGVNSACTRRRCWMVVRQQRGDCRKIGACGDFHCQNTLPTSAGSELVRALHLSRVRCPWLYYARLVLTSVSEPEAEIC